MNNIYPFVSVIIPAFNEEKHIGKCLESIANLDYPRERYEIILVDNGSRDNTILIGGKYTEAILVYPNVNVSELRNLGAKKAKGDVYAFIDGDCVADKDWLKIAVSSLSEEKCITGAYCQISPESTWVERAWGLRIPKGRREVPHLGAANLIVPAEVFNQVGGFDPGLRTGEDYEFCIRARAVAKVVLDDRIRVVHNGNPKTIKDFLKREMWHGMGAFGSIRMQKLDKPLIGTFLFAVFTLLQFGSIVYIHSTYGKIVLANASIGIILLVASTVYHKNQRERNIVQLLQLFSLFYFYYFARSISLVYMLLNRDYSRKKQVA